MNQTQTRRLLSRDFLNERLVPELEADTVQYFDHLRRYLFAQQYAAGCRVLDIACGTGYGGDILLRGGASQVTGLDLSLEALRYARTRRAVHLGQANAYALPFPAAAFGLIVSFETLEHLATPEQFLAEARRVLTPDGTLILSAPNRAAASPGSTTPFSPYHAFEPTLDELPALLTRSGWQVLHLHGQIRSRRAAALAGPTAGPYARDPRRTAWTAYARNLFRAALPTGLYRWLNERRHIPTLDISDSVLTQQATAEAAYFVVVCRVAG